MPQPRRARPCRNYRKNQEGLLPGRPWGCRLLHSGRQGQGLRCLRAGKEAVVAIHGNEDFFGESCLNGHPLRDGDGRDDDGMRDHAARQGGHRARPSRTSQNSPRCLCRTYCLGTPALRRTWSTSSSIQARSVWQECSYLDGEFWEGGKAAAGHSEDKPRDARRDGRHHKVACKLVHEQVSQARVHRVQRNPGNPQFLVECGVTRQSSSQDACRKGKMNPVYVVSIHQTGPLPSA